MEAYVVEVLREEGPKGMHITALAQKVKMEPNFLLRIMRLLTAHNIFLEMGAGSQWFANNRVSLRMDSKEPLSRLLGEKKYVFKCLTFKLQRTCRVTCIF